MFVIFYPLVIPSIIYRIYDTFPSGFFSVFSFSLEMPFPYVGITYLLFDFSLVFFNYKKCILNQDPKVSFDFSDKFKSKTLRSLCDIYFFEKILGFYPKDVPLTSFSHSMILGCVATCSLCR